MDSNSEWERSSACGHTKQVRWTCNHDNQTSATWHKIWGSGTVLNIWKKIWHQICWSEISEKFWFQENFRYSELFRSSEFKSEFFRSSDLWSDYFQIFNFFVKLLMKWRAQMAVKHCMCILEAWGDIQITWTIFEMKWILWGAKQMDQVEFKSLVWSGLVFCLFLRQLDHNQLQNLWICSNCNWTDELHDECVTILWPCRTPYPFRSSFTIIHTLCHSYTALQSPPLHRALCLSIYSNYVPLCLWLQLLPFHSDYLLHLVSFID